MWRIAGARSTRRLMAIHAGASEASSSPPSSSKCSQQAGAALQTHPGWEHFMIITIIFPQKIIHRGLCQKLDCTATGAYGADFVWRVWWKWSHAPVKLLSRRPEASRSVSTVSSPTSFIFLSGSTLSELSPLSDRPVCATNHLYGLRWHLLLFSSLKKTISEFTNKASRLGLITKSLDGITALESWIGSFFGSVNKQGGWRTEGRSRFSEQCVYL